RQCLLRRLYAWLHADDVGDVLGKPLAELNQERHDPAPLRQRRNVRLKRCPRLLPFQIRSKLDLERRLIFERIGLRVAFDEEVDRIDDLVLKDEIDQDLKRPHFFWKDATRLPIAERVLLPVQEMAAGRNLERVRLNRRTRVRRRPQPNDLRTE